jgi:hypothetical protein
MEPEKQKTVRNKDKVFIQRLDFYWQYIAIYAIILLIYSILKGSISKGTLTLVVYDPIVILLLIFILSSFLPLLVHYYKQKSIIVGPDFIIFKSRFREKRYSVSDIISISMARVKQIKVRRGTYRIIKVQVQKRRLPVRIRPSSFWNEHDLVESIGRLKKALNK